MDYQNCTLCPRMCGVDRSAGQLGFCGCPGVALVAKTMLHHWEEPALAGSGGSGAIFFGGCTLHCRYCQNAAISRRPVGKPVDGAGLRILMEELLSQGAENIDLVTPTQYLPTIAQALEEKLPVPVVFNSGGYERVETLRRLEGLVDVYLPDLKYADNALAARLSRAPDYFETATAAIREMYRQVGSAVLEDGQLTRGLLVRHLVLPGHLDNSLRVIEWLAETFPKRDVLVSLMSQYVPVGEQEPPLDRRLTAEEYAGAVSWLELCGLKNGYVQDAAAATTEYLPVFDFEGLE